MKKIILIFFFLLGCVVFSQTTYDWMNTAPDGNWRQGASGARWFGGSCGGGCFDEPGFGILRFNNNHQLTMTNNVPGTYNIHQIIFGSSNTSNRTIGNAGANIIRFFDSSGADPKIENQSSGSHIISFNILGDGDAGDPLEINPVSGNLTFNNTIGNQGSPIDIYGNNGFTARFNNIISGAGAFRIRQNSKVIFNDLNTYSGNTELDNGELWIETTGDAIASGSAIWLGNGGQLGNTTKIFLSRAAGGTTFSRNINVNPGNANTRFLGGLNTSGTNTFSGSILRSASGRPLTIEVVNAGGTVAFTGVINGSDNITKIGPGTMQISTSNSGMTGTWLVENGTLVADNYPARLNSRPITLGTSSTSGTFRFTGTSTTFTSSALTVNAGGGSIFNASATNFSFSDSFALGGTLTVGAESTGTLRFTGTISGSNGVTIAGTGKVAYESAAKTYTGTTRLNSGTLEPTAANYIANTSNFIFNGGTYSTGATTGYDATVGTLQLLENSTIRLGDGGNTHTLTFAASNGVSWTSGRTLTITNWQGTPGISGTYGKVRIGSNQNLTSDQLSQIVFQGFSIGAIQLSNGEIVPRPLSYRSKQNGNWNQIATWQTSNDNGTTWIDAVATPTSANGSISIRDTHTVTVTAAVTIDQVVIDAGGKVILSEVTLTIANGTGDDLVINGTYERTSSSTSMSISSGANVICANGGTYIHNAAGGSLPTITWQDGSLLNVKNTINGTGFNQSFWNVLIEGGNGTSISSDATSRTMTVRNNFEQTGGNFHIKTSNAGGTHTLNVRGNIIHSGGGFNWNFNTSDNTSITNIFVGGDYTISGTASYGGYVNDNSCASGVFFDGSGITQTFTSSLALAAGGAIRDRFYYKTTSGPSGLNEVYNGTVAQNTVNGTCGATPPTGYERWPTTGILLKNFTVHNTSLTGVTLRNAREINGVLTLTDGELITGACSTATNNTPLLTMAAGSSVSGGSNASYVKGVISKVGNTAFTFPVGGNGKYAPIYLSAPGTVTDQFTTCYNDANATGGTTKETGVRDVSTCEHWFLNRSAGSSAVNVSLNLNNDRCATQTCGQIVNLDGTVWRNRGSITPAVPNNSYVTSNPTTSFGTFTWASGVLPVNHTNSATGDETKIGFGTQATMSTDFPNNRTGGFIAFDTKSKGFVIPRVSNANRPAGAEGLLIYNTDSNCMQLFSSGAWKCIEPVCE